MENRTQKSPCIFFNRALYNDKYIFVFCRAFEPSTHSRQTSIHAMYSSPLLRVANVYASYNALVLLRHLASCFLPK